MFDRLASSMGPLVAPLFLASLLAAAAPFAACAQQAAPLPAVTVAPAAEADVDRSSTFTGRVEAINSVEIRARVSGFVQEMGFDEGGHVTAGDILFRIEPDAYEAAVEQVRGQLAAAEAEKTLADIEV
ncbi:MAG: biotin/lipoyl-binding protein, partial [Pseudomonadota bacterium]